jgi:hypothetical protein
MRFGIHSGPVTAGVLRGEKARFQLFGDTINTAARMESTGVGGRVHLSEQTANLLIAAGKAKWVEKREGVIVAKGKGEMQTYWLSSKTQTPVGSISSRTEGSGNESSQMGNVPSIGTSTKDWGQTPLVSDGVALMSSQVERLVGWNAETMIQLLQQIVASRMSAAAVTNKQSSLVAETLSTDISAGATVLDEVAEIITLPKFNANPGSKHVDPASVDLGRTVKRQVHEYVSFVADVYQKNPFHNFEHASHVTMVSQYFSQSQYFSRLLVT